MQPAHVVVDWKELAGIIGIIVVVMNVLSAVIQTKLQGKMLTAQHEEFKQALKTKLDVVRYERERSACFSERDKCQIAHASDIARLQEKANKEDEFRIDVCRQLGEISQFMRGQIAFGPKEMADCFMTVLMQAKKTGLFENGNNNDKLKN